MSSLKWEKDNGHIPSRLASSDRSFSSPSAAAAAAAAEAGQPPGAGAQFPESEAFGAAVVPRSPTVAAVSATAATATTSVVTAATGRESAAAVAAASVQVSAAGGVSGGVSGPSANGIGTAAAAGDSTAATAAAGPVVASFGVSVGAGTSAKSAGEVAAAAASDAVAAAAGAAARALDDAEVALSLAESTARDGVHPGGALGFSVHGASVGAGVPGMRWGALHKNKMRGDLSFDNWNQEWGEQPDGSSPTGDDDPSSPPFGMERMDERDESLPSSGLPDDASVSAGRCRQRK